MDVNQTYDLKKAFIGILANLPIGIFLILRLNLLLVEDKLLMFSMLAFFVEVVLCGILASLAYELSLKHKDLYVYLSFLIPFSILGFYEGLIIEFKYYFVKPWKIASLISTIGISSILAWFLWTTFYSFLLERLKIEKTITN